MPQEACPPTFLYVPPFPLPVTFSALIPFPLHLVTTSNLPYDWGCLSDILPLMLDCGVSPKELLAHLLGSIHYGLFL